VAVTGGGHGAGPPAPLTIVEKNVATGSCPFLYAWDGERFAFVTDLLDNTRVPIPPGASGHHSSHNGDQPPGRLTRNQAARSEGGQQSVRAFMHPLESSCRLAKAVVTL
jgi:hypothetical protein